MIEGGKGGREGKGGGGGLDIKRRGREGKGEERGRRRVWIRRPLRYKRREERPHWLRCLRVHIARMCGGGEGGGRD